MYYDGCITIGSPRITVKGKLTQPFLLPSTMFEAIDATKYSLSLEEKPKKVTLYVGERYSLSGVSCEGFEMPKKTYVVKGFVDEYGEVAVNAVIVKQVGGDVGHIYTLSKNDCECLGIEYENGLQLFPREMDWRYETDSMEFDKHNLASTPLSAIDGTVRHVLLRLDGFKDYSDGYVMTPSGKLIKEDEFKDTLCVITNEPIVFSDSFAMAEKTYLQIKLAYPKNKVFNHANFITKDDKVYLLIELKTVGDSSDGYVGVRPKYIDGLDPNKVFTVIWDEDKAVTVEAYEEAKLRAKREEEERKRKAEEKKRKEAEAARKLKAERERKIMEAIDRMTNYRLTMPTMPNTSDIKFGDTSSWSRTVEYEIGKVDSYISQLNRSIERLSEDVETISALGYNIFSKY